MEWTLRELDADGNPIEPQQEVVEQVEEQQEVVEQVEEQQEVVEQVEEQQEVVEQVEEQQEIVEETEEVLDKPQQFELDDNSILSYLKERHSLELGSIDDLKKTEKQELSEDVEKFLEYKKETGRGFEDFINLQKDWTKVDDVSVLKEYYKETKPHLDDEDINHILSEDFSYDESMDEASDIRKKKIAYKEELYKARNHFEGLKEKYKAPLESSATSIPENYKEAFNFYSEYKEQSEQEKQLQQRNASIFKEKTEQLFNQEFKGFEFNIGDKKQVFKPGDLSAFKNEQLDISNFFNKHLNQDGTVKDAAKYHRALFAANNVDSLAKHFYEQGLADATEGLVKETKNIDMSVRDNKTVDVKGTKFRVVDSGEDFSFKIKKR
jgi:hypothetical protein